MWLRIDHTTAFSYDSPIAEAYTELRLRPLEDEGQHCASFRLVTDPPGLLIREHRDHVGNHVCHFDILGSHAALTVTASSEVLTRARFVDERRLLTPLERYEYLAPSSHVPFASSVEGFVARYGTAGSVAERALALMRGVRQELVYEPGATHVQTRADEVLALRRGVCQDFAHVLLAAARREGIPSRYVSGYLYDPEISGGSVASHAWVDVFDEARGWVSLDPTHGREQTAAYVRLAVGRDYFDVPPTRGVYKGAAEETLSVEVSVQAL